MEIKFRNILLVFLIFFSAYSYAQKGTPLITNFSFGATSVDNESWAMAQDQYGQMLFANRRGIVTFDGIKWNTINTPSVPLSLYFDINSEKIFVGCKNNVGYLQKDDNGAYQFMALNTDKSNLGRIKQISCIDDQVYFYSSRCVLRYSIKTEMIKIWKAEAGEPFTGFIHNNDNVYVNVNKLGLHILTENIIKPIKEGEKFAKHKILFHIRYSRAQVLVGLDNDSLYLFNNYHIANLEIGPSAYIKDNILAGGIYIDKDNYAISTVTGGCLIIDKKSNESTYTLNYQNGLPDDEVYALGLDRNKGLWILHEYGMSRVDLKLPIRNLNNYPGLEGNLTSTHMMNNTLYVSTSEGVFYLNEVEKYEEIEILVKVNTVKEDKLQKELEEEIEDPIISVQELTKNTATTTEKKKGFFGKLFGKKKNRKKKKKEKNNEDIIKPVQVEKVEPDEKFPIIKEAKKTKKKKTISPKRRKSIKYEKQKIYALQSISHKYSKIKNIEGKIKQLLSYNNTLLVAANTGLYQISDFKAIKIIDNSYINFIYRSKIDSNKFYIGTSKGILSLAFKKNKWIIGNQFNEFKASVYSIIELDKNTLWLGCENIAYNIIIDNVGNPVKTKPYPFETDFTERILVRNVLNIPYFFLSTGIYSYSKKKDEIVFNTKKNKGFTGQSKYIFSQDNITWIFNEYKWASLHETSKYSKLPEDFLAIFGDVNNIYVDDQNNLWIIDNNNSIFKIINTRKDYEEIFDVYLKFINGKQGKLLSLTNLVLDYNENSLSFNISAPYFVKSNAIQFQYYIEGLSDEWSDWRKDISIDFPYIPNGEYILHIKAKNILGKETNIKTFTFEIRPPFWKRWWFIIGCVFLFYFLMWFIFSVRQRKLMNQQRLLEEKVVDRTMLLAKEVKKSEELLLNILPKETADELKKYGTAKAHYHKFASVMFTDFKNFTQLSEKLSSEELVKEIDYCFSSFDDIIEKYQIEKIKTIGDAYMCASGIHHRDETSPILITLAGLDIITFMEQYQKDRKKLNLPSCEIRVGIHSGPLTSGVVGKKKFAYDIWGDTVNTASRLESGGEVGILNVSETTYQKISPYFDCDFRGNIEAKNKGEIAMYNVIKIKTKFAMSEKGLIPNQLMLDSLNLK